jgi:voltage-gated potassium channel
VKSIGAVLSYLAAPLRQRNLRVLATLVAIFLVAVVTFSALFHVLMEREGQSHSWATAVYWTVVTMSTLGFGDITFQSDLGRVFSVVVLISGSVFILVLLPFTFIQFVFIPWMEARQRARAPRTLPADTTGHVLLVGIGPIEESLIRRLVRAQVPYVALIGDLDEALKLFDQGFRVMVGDLDDPASYRNARVEHAALLATSNADTTNTNVAFTVGEISESVPVVATADRSASVDILGLAGCDVVLQLGEMLGQAMARRVLTPGGRSLVIGRFGGLLIAEAKVPESLVGRPLVETGLRARTGITVAGIWSRGVLEVARPTTVLEAADTLVLAGARPELDRYDELSAPMDPSDGLVLIIGGGRVGRAAGRALAAAGTPYTIIEKQPERVRDPAVYVAGDAAELTVLEEAGIRTCRAVIVTTHDDDVNVYLTIYCRQLRPDIQVISRARLDRNVTTLHRAGADSVLSYGATGASAIWNVLTPDDTLQLADGLDVFRAPVPAPIVGRPLRDAGLRERTGCTVVAVTGDDGFAAPVPEAPLPAGELLLIGDEESEARFFHEFPTPRRRGLLRSGTARTPTLGP